MDEATLARRAFTARLEHVRDHLLNRLQARLGGLAQPATAFVSQPEPKTIGSYARGRQLMAGNFLFCRAIWSKPRPARSGKSTARPQ